MTFDAHDNLYVALSEHDTSLKFTEAGDQRACLPMPPMASTSRAPSAPAGDDPGAAEWALNYRSSPI